MLRTLLAAAPLFAAASAFSDTHPVVAWSSHETNILNGVPRSGDVLSHLLASDAVCSFDAIVLAEQPGLHASDLRTLSPSSKFASLLDQAPSSLQLPYARRSTHEDSLLALANALTSLCDSRLVGVVPGESDLLLESGRKHVVAMYLPEVIGEAGARKSAVDAHSLLFSSEIAAVAAAAPRHLVIYAGAPASETLARRQLSVSSIADSEAEFPIVQAPKPSPVLQQAPAFASPSGSILTRYQLLTPGLITSLLIALFALLPVLLFSVNALSSIQSPLRVEAPKGYNADAKKSQ